MGNYTLTSFSNEKEIKETFRKCLKCGRKYQYHNRGKEALLITCATCGHLVEVPILIYAKTQNL